MRGLVSQPVYCAISCGLFADVGTCRPGGGLSNDIFVRRFHSNRYLQPKVHPGSRHTTYYR
jgi:hypothetical protein